MVLPAGLLPARPPSTHKGDAGYVFVLGGSIGFSGAAVLCARGALRTGAGLVIVGVPKSLCDVVAVQQPEAMVKPLPETKAGSLSLPALPEIRSWVGRADAMAVGPGLSQQPQTQQLLRQLLPKITKPLVLDADGLNAVAEDVEVLKTVTGTAIVTPHPGEMGRLARLSAADVQRDRRRIAQSFAQRYGVVVVLKGHQTVVANVDGAVHINESGNPGMASGGCGDVLTGVIAALLGQRLSLWDAARLGAYLHGLAGDLAATQLGPVGLLASDVADRIPQAIRQYQRSV